MTDRTRQTAGLVAQFTLALAIAGLAIQLGRLLTFGGVVYGTVSTEHQQIFQMIREKCK